jgi:site-specific recombinase XerD
MLMLLRGTGGRIGEVIGATMDGLNLEGGVLFTTGKGDQVRALLLNEPEMGALHQWLELRAMIPTRSDHVFIGGSGRHEGRPLTRSAIYKIMDKLRIAAGLPKGTRLNPHSFRHGFALKSLDNGARIDEVSQMMGHSSVAVTIDYYGQRDVKYLRMVHQRTSPTHQVKPSDFKVESKRKR